MQASEYKRARHKHKHKRTHTHTPPPKHKEEMTQRRRHTTQTETRGGGGGAGTRGSRDTNTCTHHTRRHIHTRTGHADAFTDRGAQIHKHTDAQLTYTPTCTHEKGWSAVRRHTFSSAQASFQNFLLLPYSTRNLSRPNGAAGE